MTIAGFTGTRNGLTSAQARSLEALLHRTQTRVLHHGDCNGADAAAHHIAGELSIARTIHPPEDPRLRAFCEVNPYTDGMPRTPLPYLTRNKRIVEETHWLIACPKEHPLDDYRSGGTWYTIRYAREKGRMVVIIWPDGLIEIDGWRNGL